MLTVHSAKPPPCPSLRALPKKFPPRVHRVHRGESDRPPSPPVSHKIRGKLIITLIRSHWRSENELHGTLHIHIREDVPWWVRRGYGLINTEPLRAIAYNLLAIARAVRLCIDKLIGWPQHRDWLRDAIVWPSLLADTGPLCALPVLADPDAGPIDARILPMGPSDTYAEHRPPVGLPWRSG